MSSRMSARDYRALSLWHDTAEDDFTPRPALPGPAEYDVVVVGAGLTGLWSAYYLRRADPTLRDRRARAGGRRLRRLGPQRRVVQRALPDLVGQARPARRSAEGALRLHRAMQETVREVGRVVEAEGIDAHYHRGGTVNLARTQVQLARLTERGARPPTPAGSPRTTSGCSRRPRRARCSPRRACSAAATRPHCAAIHPARLVRGLARVVEASGVTIFEHTRVRGIEPGVVRTEAGDVRAEVVLRCTEGYTPRLDGLRARRRPGLLADGRDRAAPRGDLDAHRAGRPAHASATGGT